MQSIRFSHEELLETSLMDSYALEPMLAHFENEGGLEQLRSGVLSTAVRITPILSPRLHGLFCETMAQLSIEEPVELFITQSAEANAWTFQRAGEETPGAVVLTSKIVEMMSDDELRFVFGHELGHYVYKHSRILEIGWAVEQDETGNPQLPALLQCKLSTLMRLAEISADRAGYIVSGRDLDTAAAVFFKLGSGLGEEHLRFDTEEFLSQLDDLLGMPRKDFLSSMSHPAIPIRVRALQLLDEHLLDGTVISEKDDLDNRVYEITHLMEYEVSDEDEVKARDFLLAGGILAAYVEKEEPSRELYDHLVQLVLPFTSDPESHFARVSDIDQAERMLEDSCSWLKENTGEEKFMLFRMLLSVAAFDGKLTSDETSFMSSIASSLGIPEQAYSSIMNEARTYMLQNNMHSGVDLPKFR